jgi:hypothetical protein
LAKEILRWCIFTKIPNQTKIAYSGQ